MSDIVKKVNNYEKEKEKENILSYIYARNWCINRSIFYWWRKTHIQMFNINDDREFILKLCKMKVDIFEFVSDRLKLDEEIVILSLIHKSVLELLNKIFFTNKDFVLKILKQEKNLCLHLPYLFKNYLSDKLLDDEDIILEWIKNNGYNFKYASNRIKNDKNIVLKAIKLNWYVLECITESYKNDKELVLEAIKSKSNIFRHASKKLKDEKNITLKAIKYNSGAFEYISDRLKDDEDIVLSVLKSNINYFRFISERLRDNDKIVFDIVKKEASFLEYASYRLKNNKNFILKLVESNIENTFNLYSNSIFPFIWEELMRDKTFILNEIVIKKIIKLNWLDFIELKKDKKFMLEIEKYIN